MSLYVTLAINDERIGDVVIQRHPSDTDTSLDAVNRYTWKHMHHGRCLAEGHLTHRYGDGAAALAATVLQHIAEPRTEASD